MSRPPSRRALALLLTLALAPAATAQLTSWNGTTGNFTDPTKWSNGVPGATGTAQFKTATAYTVSFPASAATAGFTQSQGVATLALGGNTYSVTAAGGFKVGDTNDPSAVLNLNDGTLNLSGGGSIGMVAGNSSFVSVNSSAALAVAGPLALGTGGGDGQLVVQSGGAATAQGEFTLGDSAAGRGLLTVAGTWTHTNAGTLNRLTLTPGTSRLSVTGSLAVAGQAGSGIVLADGGQLDVNGGGSVTTPNLTAPGSPALTNGTLTIAGGTYDNGNRQFALGSATTAHLVLDAGATFNPVDLTVGANGTSRLTVQGGSALTTSVQSSLAESGSGVTVATVTGAGSAWTHTGGDVFLGSVSGSGSTTLAVAAGGTVGMTFAGNARLAVYATGGVTVTGGGSSLSVGPGRIVMTGGTLTVDQGGAVSAGSLTAGGGVTVGGSGTSTLTLTTVLSVLSGGSLTINSGGTVTAPSVSVSAGGTLTLSAGTLNVGSDPGGGTVNHTFGTLNYTADVTVARPVTILGGTLSVAAGRTATFQTTIVNGGTLSGPGSFVTPGGLGTAFTAVTLALGTPLTLGGADSLTNSTLGGATTVLASGFTPILTRTTNGTSGHLALNAAAQLSVAQFVNNGQLILADGPSAAARTRLTVTGPADLALGGGFLPGGGNRTFVGTPAGAEAGGRAVLDLGGRQAVVAGGLLVNNGLVTNGTVVADFGSLVKGAGTFSTLPVTRNGGVYQPGNSPGRATVGAAELAGGGVLNFQINNAAGAAGPSPDGGDQVSGWGLTRVRAFAADPDLGTTTGGLTVTATPGSRYTVRLQTLRNPTTLGQDVSGAMANFDPAQGYTWTFLTYEGSYTGPADLNGVFAIDASQFINPTAGGAFSVLHDPAGRAVNLVFTPVPEPALGLLAAGVGLLAVRRRR